MFFLRLLGFFCRTLTDSGAKVTSKIDQKSIKKGMLKMIPDTVQKSLKSDAPDFGKSSKTIVLSSIFVVSTHVH